MTRTLADRSARSARSPETARDDRDRRRMAHNPEVEGSNPSPATKARGPLSNRKRASGPSFVNRFCKRRARSRCLASTSVDNRGLVLARRAVTSNEVSDPLMGRLKTVPQAQCCRIVLSNTKYQGGACGDAGLASAAGSALAARPSHARPVRRAVKSIRRACLRGRGSA